METAHAEAIALHRWAVIAEATAAHLTPAERGAIVRAAAEKHHAHPDGTHGATRGTPSTAGSGNGGREGSKRSVLPPRTTGAVRAHPELFAEAAALRLELSSRSAAQIARILAARDGITVAEQTIRDQLRRRGLHREAVAAGGNAFGRYEASRPNERWITDVQSVIVEALFGPLLVASLQFSSVQFSSVRPTPRRPSGARNGWPTREMASRK